MYKTLATIGWLSFLSLPLFANPIDPNSEPIISEVLVQSPLQWYIELNLPTIGRSCKTAQCTTSAYRLQIASTGKTYNLQLVATANRIPVITRESIIDIPEAEQVPLASRDTIYVMDTSTSYPLKWKFPIRPVAPGNSLYNITQGYDPNPIETDRVTIGIPGNPPAAYLVPFISEVQALDSAHWAIELDCRQSGLPFVIAPPCTVSWFRMKLGNSPVIYSVKAYFDTSGIAVLRPGDITAGSAVVQKLPIPTTINLLDSTWNATLLKGLFWSFRLDTTVKPGHSLIKGGGVETMRASIGSRTTYSTRYEIHTQESNHAPVSGLYIYNIVAKQIELPPFGDPITVQCLNLFARQSDSVTVFDVDIDHSPQWYGFSRDPIVTDPYNTQSEFTGTPWEGYYIDSLLSKKDTLVMPALVPVSLEQTLKSSSRPKFFIVNRNHTRMLFSAVVPGRVRSAQIKVFALDGKLSAVVNFGPITSAGTYSCEWNNHKSIPAGMYLCTLKVDGAEVQSRKVSVR